MEHYRFGRSAIALEEAIAFRAIRAKGRPGEVVAMRVFFRGHPSVVFRGEDAAAITQYADSRNPPPVAQDSAPLPASGDGTVSRALDPETGKPLPPVPRGVERKGRA